MMAAILIQQGVIMTKRQLTFKILKEAFTIHRFPPDHPVPVQLGSGRFYSICKTDEELSIVCDSNIAIDSPAHEKQWSCLKVAGPLDFSLTGILADISGTLANAGISIFAISTFDTDYILVKTRHLTSARRCLTAAGHLFA
jgi:hypothetical protein